MGSRPLEVLVVVFACRCFNVQAGSTAELLARWSLDELENGHFVESQSQNASYTLLLARDGATHTRTGVLTVQDVNYLSVSVPNGDCLVNKTACGKGLVVSFWMKLKGFLSEVIEDRDHYQTVLKRWLDTVIDPTLRWINCYRASEHGWNASTFHARCDFKGPSVTLVRVKNFVFGGFTDQDWGGSPGPKKSRNSFLFLLSNDSDKELEVKLNVKNPPYAIHNDPFYGPWFGNGDLVISDMAASNINSRSDLGEAYSLPDKVTYGSDEAGNYLAGSKYFMPDEVEVFHVECFHPLGMANGEIANDQITQVEGAPTENRAPWQARLNSSLGNTWIPEGKKAKLVVDLGSLRRILAIDAHGNRNAKNPKYPTKFGFSNGSSSQGWTSIVKDLTLDDESSIKRFIFLPSVVTRKLLVYTEDCHVKCAFAMEIYGCSAGSCQEELPIKKFTASSFAPSHEPSVARLNSSSCWRPSGAANGTKDYLEVDLGMVKVVSAITMLAKTNIQFNLQYSTESIHWKYYPDFSGSTKVFAVEGETSVNIKPMVQARYFRVYPIMNNNCFRIKLSGCTSFKGTDTAIMSSGRYPFNETGLLISNSAKALRGQYHSSKDGHVETRNPFTSMNWTRITFRLSKADNMFIYLNYSLVVKDKDPPAVYYKSNSARVINLASMSSWGNVSSTQMWSVENIQLSDLSVWINTHGDNFSEKRLPAMLDKCDFDNSPCTWKIGNWTKRRGRVPSKGTGPSDNDVYIHLESSYPRSRGDSTRFESPFLVPAYKCLTFKYHMWGKHVGRLTVYTQKDKNSNLVAKWRLSGDQGNSWNKGRVKLQRYRPFKLIFEAVVGDGFLGDIALDDVSLSTVTCDHSPNYTKSYFQAPTLEKSAIIGHLSALKSSLLKKLRTAQVKNNAWAPCYRALVDGRDIERFYSKCGEEKETITIVRVNNYIFGGYADVGWNEVREKGVAVSKSAFLFILKNNDPEAIEIFPLRRDKRHEAQHVKPHEGPTFGDGDLSLKTISTGSSQTGNSFVKWHGLSLFANADDFNISDIEVLYPKDSLCKEPCNHYEGHCDEITTKCVCDWTERNVEWCMEGDPKRIINLYHDAASYWALDSVEDLKDRARLGWGQAHGAVSLVAKGLSGQAIQLDGVSGWVDLGDLGTLCQGNSCKGDFGISLWMKYYSKANGENQNFVHLDYGLAMADLFYEANSKMVGFSLNTSSFSGCYKFSVAKGFWTHLGFSWKNDIGYLTIQKNGETLRDIHWEISHSHSIPSVNRWSLTLGAGCFPNASFDEIAVWTMSLGKDRFVEIYNTYRGPPRLNAQLSLQFTGISWRDDFHDPESDNFTALRQILRKKIINFYSSPQDVDIISENIYLSECWNDGGLVSCNLTLHYHSEGYKQFAFLLNDWIPRAKLFHETGIILLGSRNDNVPSTPVSGLKAHATGPYSVEVSWNTPSDEGIPGILTGYVVYYKETSTVGNNWRKEEVYNTEGPYPNFTITSLQAYTTYIVNVSTVSLEGEGKSASINIATDEIAPATSPEITEFYNTSARSIFVKWRRPPEPIQGVLRGYRIIYKNLNNPQSEDQNSTVDADTLFFEIRGLELNSKYEIRVLAFTVADGNESEPVVVFTDSKVLPPPDRVPEGLGLSNKTSTSCVLFWDGATNSYPDPDGAVVGYYIYYRKVGSNDTFDKLDVEEANRTVFTVENLEEYVEYEFSVAAYNIYGEGNASDTFHCKTKEDAPSSPPRNLRGVHVKPREVTIEWDIPAEEDWNGIIRGFAIMYYRKDKGNSTAEYRHVTPGELNVQLTGSESVRRKRATDFSWILSDLDEYTQYIIRILMYTIGNSEYSFPLQIRTAEAAPSSPPTKVSAVNNESSSSLLVTWSQVPYEDRNGEIRGFVIAYWLVDDPNDVQFVNIFTSTPGGGVGERRKKRAADESFKHILTKLKIWTHYYVKVAAFTISQGPFSEPYMNRTDEGVPCLPPQYVTFDVPGLTSLLVKWKPVPEHCRNGIILGYRVKYRRLDGVSGERVENTPIDILYAFLYDLDTFANYSIGIVAFTSKGEGNSTLDLSLPDNMGSKSTPMNLTAYNYTTTTSVNVTWGPTEDVLILERILGYRVSYRAVRIGDREVEEEDEPTYHMTVRKETFDVVLKGLEPYTRYQVNVSGFSRKGDGPSAISAGDTCRCHKRLTTNYRLFPPYMNQFPLTHNGNISVENMTGMLPQILNDLIVTCCQTCAAHGESYVDFMYNGNNGKAKRKSEREMKTLIEDSNDLSFPVYGWKWQENYGPDHRYIPLVESPGVAFIIIEPDDRSPAQRLLNKVFATWPYCVISSLLAAIAGIIVWFLDTKYNSQQFPPSFWRGSWNGFWWAFISMTTLGYGDKVPSAYISKSFAIVWILTGLVLMSILSSALTSAISRFVVQTNLILYGTKVAVIHGTPEYRLAVTRNAIVDKDHPYETFSEVYDALINKEVQGMLIDTYEAGTKRDHFKDPRIRIHTIYDYKSTYGVVLAGNSTRLLQCSKSYTQSHQDEMFEHIGKFIYSIKEDHAPESVEIASGLFDPKNNMFKSFAYTMTGVVSLAILLGLVLELRQWFYARQRQQLGDPDREKTKHLQEMRTSVEDFYRNFKTNYSQMAKRYRSQLKSIETRLQENNMSSSRASRLRSKIVMPGFLDGNDDGKTKSAAENFYENPEAFLY